MIKELPNLKKHQSISAFAKGVLFTLFVIALSWVVIHWKAVQVAILHPDEVASLTVQTQLVLKK